VATPLQTALAQLATLAAELSENVALDLCTISRPTFTTSVFGSSPPTYATVATGVACNWSPLSETRSAGHEREVTGQTRAVGYYRLTDLPPGTDAKEKDRIVVAARDAEPAHTFEVQTVVRKGAGYPVQLNCTLEE